MVQKTSPDNHITIFGYFILLFIPFLKRLQNKTTGMFISFENFFSRVLALLEVGTYVY